MESSNIMQWGLELREKLFQVIVDRDEKTVTIVGTVDDPKEKREVEEYVMMKGPRTYRLVSEIVVAD
ncbi:MAG: hypothetical protein ACMUIS_12120 [bacterium]